ncbi:MAG: diguanylate phosphodiesterase [Clostridiales bacterium]|uniref:Diguanylate cyclase/phosphodiesterase n=1 Tax=Harryflintia acetispora TaxID=1849041 RepID=A0A9X8UK53_9FIRM|nr:MULTISPECIES: EAL domain-containing protein [Oscillospiraceae]PWM34913.1 MAG: diguanylate phosphodiesterase [Clostridiales bacterium]RGB67590.1 EAL domain-containing protein [Harryflintia acetispora]TCL44068.1 diguanylate cyclase/phosphodiesterase [Harryflintia acetispora]
MAKLLHQGSSIMKKILVPMILTMLVQAGLFYGVILWGGTVDKLNNNAYDILNERVLGRKNYLQNEMIQRWSNLSDSVQAINADVGAVLREQNSGIEDIRFGSELSNQVLESVSDDIIYLMRRSSVTGSFIVLGGGEDLGEQEGEHRYTGLYLRDQDPEYSSTDNSDIMIERAPSAIAKRLGIPMDTWWNPYFSFTPEQGEGSFYYKPLWAAINHPEIGWEDLGYWCEPFSLSQEDIQVITYSVPLMHEGKPYGVLGIEISVDYLRRQMPYDEIGADKMGAYLVAVDHGGGLSFDNAVGSGPIFKQLYEKEKQTQLRQPPVYGSVYEIEPPDGRREHVYGCVQYFQLYNSNTPFETDRWALIGIMRRQDLLAFSDQVKALVAAAFVLSLAIGMGGIYVVSTVITHPITSLVQKVKSSDPRLPVSLEETRIDEIDELAQAIENLSLDVADSASKLAQIIEMTNIPLGAFEYYKETGKTYCTNGFLRLFGIPSGEGESGYIEPTNLHDRLKELSGQIEEINERRDEILYKLSNRRGRPRWVRLRVVENDSRVLGVASDITSETLEKRRIEYERDYDLLTNLLNRRAFHTIMRRKFEEPETLGVGALIMLDLDNLKYINDTYGHDYGDAYIRCTADVLRRFAPEKAILSRMSGDEFYIFLFGYGDQDQLRGVIEHIKQEIRKTVLPLPNNEHLRIRASAGVAWYPQDSTSYEQLIKYADFAMYKVKNTVKGEFSEFDIQSYNRDSYLLHSREELNRLIEEELVEYYFQPIVDARTGRIFAYEALMRPKLQTLKTPKEILALARSQSKLYQIERLTWFKALEAYVEHRQVIGNCKVFINSIPNQTLTEEDIAQIEGRFGDLLHNIVIELTEEEKPDERSTIHKQRFAERWGAELALDDFGTGYNGDAVLLSLTPSYLKIDMSIVQGIDKDEYRQKLLENLLSYARMQHIKVIAEGVETSGEMKILIASGVDYLQGFYLGSPNPVPQSGNGYFDSANSQEIAY